jgi:PAS fold.
LPFEQALGEGWLQALHPEDRVRVSEEWQHSVAGDCPFSLEFRFVRPDGTVAWVYGQSAEIFDSKGGIVGYVGTITDISIRKKAEATLAEQVLFLRESQSIAHLAGWKSNPDSDLLSWTDEMYHMLDHPQDEPISHVACFRYFDPAGSADGGKGAAGGDAQRYPLQVELPDGQRPVAAVSGPISAASAGWMDRMVGILAVPCRISANTNRLKSC